MGRETAIEWMHHTFNPWHGCDAAPRRFFGDNHWREPLRWDVEARAAGERRRVFCASMADVGENRIDLDTHRARLFDVIRRTPHLDWLLLTKRPGTWQEVLLRAQEHAKLGLATVPVAGSTYEWINYWLCGMPPANVWMGTTVEDQRRANERLPELNAIPAVERFVSAEPLLESVSFGAHLDASRTPDAAGRPIAAGVSWVIVGGESGGGARPFDVAWARDIMAQCAFACVPVFVKQMGARPVGAVLDVVRLDRKGGDPSEWPPDLRVRQLPGTA
jgi:protein gp37